MIMRKAMLAGRRPLVFLGVGALGLVVQLSVLSLLTGVAGWHYLPATLIAVLLAVLHNFVWHERWTWADRPVHALRETSLRLGWFAATTGVISVGGNLGLMTLYAGRLGIPTIIANVAAIASMSVANFLAADYWTFRQSRPGVGRSSRHAAMVGLISLSTLGSGSIAETAELKLQTIAAWNRYVIATEQHIDQEYADRIRTHESAWSPADRQLIWSGEIAIAQLESRDTKGNSIDVPSGSIHHWRGAILIPHVTLDQVLDAAKHPVKQQDVLDLKVMDRSTDSLHLYLKLIRDGIVTVTYNTEHDIRFTRYSSTVASCRSIATKIAELENAGTPSERERPIGTDHGFLWRLNAYWRYEQVENGVVVELESVTLGRDMPMLIGPLIRPVVNRIARESVTKTLDGFKGRFSAR
jgi:putative flippase GtrA